MRQSTETSFATLTREDIDRLEQIYLDSFPEDERRPWHNICHNPSPHFRALPLYQGGLPCGFVSIWQLRNAVFVEHLVVDPGLRGLGIGSTAMGELLATLETHPLILEVEPAELGQEAKRRQDFYRRLGLILLPYEYTQPPYTAGGKAIRLCLMASQQLSESQVCDIVHELYQIVYNTTKQ